MIKTPLITGCFAGLMLLAAAPIEAAELFRDNLQDGVNWEVNSTSADVSAAFGFDYGMAGLSIPEAPNTRPGDAATRGLRVGANLADPPSAESLIAYPIGQNFTGAYQLRFDAWMNLDLDALYNNDSAGITEFIGGGIGYDSVSAGVNTGAQIIATGDGGSVSDWRAFADGNFLSSAEMTAGTRNGFDPYYSDFLPAVVPPVGQLQTYVGPDGSVAGSPGFQWLTFEVNTANGRSGIWIEKPDGDRLHLTTVNADGSQPYTSDGNIGLIYADFFSSVAAVPQLQFGLFDNVEVNSIPEPNTMFLLVGAILGLVACGYRRTTRPSWHAGMP